MLRWVYRESPDQYWLYTTSNAKPPRVHIATSTDGLQWRNVSDGPVPPLRLLLISYQGYHMIFLSS